MEDRFKFRAWDIRGNEMHYDIEETYDDLFKAVYTDNFYMDSFGEFLKNGRFVIEQCTGLKDKKGNLIYEGDILKLTGDDNVINKKYSCIVIYHNGMFCFNLSGGVIQNKITPMYPSLKDGNEYEIIGNIHTKEENKIKDKFIFRQPIYTDNKFSHFHYWGYGIEGGEQNKNNFTPPMKRSDNPVWKCDEQSTGLRDTYGNLIFTGDIVRSKTLSNEKEKFIEIIVKDKDIEDGSPWEIIGNIHKKRR